ncbi:MAG: cation transporter [Chitinophagales bacterium]|nr:cation transporter [Chitinophagales bacterium]
MKLKVLSLVFLAFAFFVNAQAQCSKSQSKSCCKAKTESSSSTSGSENAVVQNGGMAMVDLKVEGMHCGGCENKVKSVLMNIDGVSEVQAVSATENKAVLTYDASKTSEEAIVKTLAEQTGYAVAVNTAGAKEGCSKSCTKNSGKSCNGQKSGTCPKSENKTE